MTAWRTVLLVALGSAVGGALRAGVALWLGGASWPLATLVVNLVGSFLLGVVIGAPALTAEWRTLLGAGLCGGLTTFSALALESVQTAAAGHPERVALYLLATLVLGLGACWAGMQLAR